jgi:hypothetical protein
VSYSSYAYFLNRKCKQMITTAERFIPELPVVTAQPLEVLAQPEVIADAEVATRFAQLTESIDASFTPAQEQALDAVPSRKVKGSAEAFNMWKA